MGDIRLIGRLWHIRYYQGGHRFRESSGSTEREDAERLLQLRESGVAKPIGHIVKRQSGSWALVISTPMRRRWFTFRTRVEAEAAAEIKLSEITIDERDFHARLGEAVDAYRVLILFMRDASRQREMVARARRASLFREKKFGNKSGLMKAMLNAVRRFQSFVAKGKIHPTSPYQLYDVPEFGKLTVNRLCLCGCGTMTRLGYVCGHNVRRKKLEEATKKKVEKRKGESVRQAIRRGAPVAAVRLDRLRAEWDALESDNGRPSGS